MTTGEQDNMKQEKILVIEDNVAEAINAQTELARAGFREFTAVQTLSEGLEQIQRYNGVLSDLFFPAGNTPTKQYSERFLPLYEAYKERRFKEIKDGPIKKAVEQVSGIFGVTPKEYEEKIAPLFNHPPAMKKAIRDALAGREDSERYEKFSEIEKAIRDGTNLPLGIIACEAASQYRIPAVIVTSTSHHHDSFEPVRSLIHVAYRDALIEGKKDWKGGVEILIQKLEGGQK